MSLIWMNGKLVDEPLAISAHERGLLLGDGIFETLCVLSNKPLWLELHLARLAQAAGALGFMFDEQAIARGVTALLNEFGLEAGALRITLTRGVAARGLAGEGEAPTLLITLDAFAAENFFQPVKLALSRIRRNPFAPSSRYKTTSYIDGIAAAREVAGLADDALMLNVGGYVASSTIANIFVIEGTHLVTPALDQGVLPGIMRKLVIAAAPDLGFSIEETAVSLARTLAADGVFLTNSLRYLRPVTEISGKKISTETTVSLKSALTRMISAEAKL